MRERVPVFVAVRSRNSQVRGGEELSDTSPRGPQSKPSGPSPRVLARRNNASFTVMIARGQVVRGSRIGQVLKVEGAWTLQVFGFGLLPGR